MGWKEESQFRFHYTSGGNDEGWQPTAVYVPDKPDNKPLAGAPCKSDASEVFLFFSSVIIATLAYQYVSHIGYVAHLTPFTQRAILGTTIVGSFWGSMALLGKKVVQTTLKAGVVLLCITILFRH